MAREFKQRSLLKLNIKNFVDMIFLREGLWTNVPSGELYADGSDMSLLLPDGEAPDLLGLSQRQVFQSAFREWVHESGVPLDGTNLTEQPMSASGVYIQGAFRYTDDAEFPHTIDYFNGRIIFESPLPNDIGPVHAPFAFRHVRVGFENRFNQQFDDPYLENQYGTNPETSMQLVYPSGNFQPFPAVFIEIDERDKQPYELGNRSAVMAEVCRFHIWTLDDLQRDDIMDVLDSQWHKRIPIIDFNKAPLPISGFFNTLNNEWVAYQLMLNNPELTTTVGVGRPIRYFADIDESNPINEQPSETYEKGQVEWVLGIYLNRPNTVIPNVFAPVRPIPPDIDFAF